MTHSVITPKSIELDNLLGPELLPTDTCDKCGPAVTANTAVLLTNGGELRFCNHCYDQRAASMAPLVAATSRNQVK